MSKAVMLSVRPEWCRRIAIGEKTLEVRKTKPKLTPPFKCYIYCTAGNYRGMFLHTSEKHGQLRFWCNPDDMMITVQPDDYEYMAYTCRGKVIGEFVCDEIEKYEAEFYQDDYDVFQGIWINIYDEDIDDEDFEDEDDEENPN